MNSVLLLKYIKWHFFDATKSLVEGWGNILWFNYNYFSIGLLLRTYFAPWRRLVWSYGRGFDPGRYLFVFSSNLVSRILGAIMRSFLIVTGVALEIILFLLAAAMFAFWLALPALILIAFFYGIFLLF